MNVNVIVVNLHHDLRSVPNFSSPDTTAEEVIELKPQDGAWVGDGGRRSSPRPAIYSLAREPRALHTTPGITTYDHGGKVRYSSQNKGLRINITA